MPYLAVMDSHSAPPALGAGPPPPPALDAGPAPPVNLAHAGLYAMWDFKFLQLVARLRRG